MLEPVLILGSNLSNGQPGRTLTRRLVAALPYALEVEQVVVSGHMGEAEAMHAWLVARGVAPEVIFIENQARSTNENLEQSFALLQDNPSWIVVTSDFHSWRTKLWAWHHGLSVRIITARTPLRNAPEKWAREALALPHSFGRIVWRRVKDRWIK